MNCIGATSYRQKPAENPLSARFRGEREGPAPEAWEGEVGDAADPDIGPLPPCPSPPACGGRGRGPAWLRREGEVGSGCSRRGAPPPHPDPLRPQGRRGGYSSRLSGYEIYACLAAGGVKKRSRFFETTAGQVTDILERLG